MSDDFNNIAFCVNVRNRHADLQATLPHNHDLLQEGEELVVLDYSSADFTTFNWLTVEQRELKRMRAYRMPGAQRWFCAHAKNVGHLLGYMVGRAKVLVNLDADNYLDPEYLAALRGTDWANVHVLRPKPTHAGTSGRVAIRADAFLTINGYDERFRHGYGYDDEDLIARAQLAGFTVRQIQINPRSAIATSLAAKKSGNAAGVNLSQSNATHRKLSQDSIAAGQYRANIGRWWGRAGVLNPERKLAASVGLYSEPVDAKPKAEDNPDATAGT